MDERLIKPESVSTIGRVPGVSTGIAVQMAEPVPPARFFQRRDPPILTLAEARHFFVDSDATAVGVADEESRSATPGSRHVQRRRVIRILPTGDAIRNVHHAEREGPGSGNLCQAPAPRFHGRVSQADDAEQPARGDEEPVGSRNAGISGGGLEAQSAASHEPLQMLARRRCPELRQSNEVSAPAAEMLGNHFRAPSTTGADVPGDDAKKRPGWLNGRPFPRHPSRTTLAARSAALRGRGGRRRGAWRRGRAACAAGTPPASGTARRRP